MGYDTASFPATRMPPTTPSAAELLAAAHEAARMAYAPYSGWHVGAAAEFASGLVQRGANVENASYGLTVCAERTAVFAGVLAGERTLRRIAVVCRDRDGAPVRDIVPCGACLQVLSEFGGPDVEVITEEGGTLRLSDYLPRPFHT